MDKNRLFKINEWIATRILFVTFINTNLIATTEPGWKSLKLITVNTGSEEWLRAKASDSGRGKFSLIERVYSVKPLILLASWMKVSCRPYLGPLLLLEEIQSKTQKTEYFREV